MEECNLHSHRITLRTQWTLREDQGVQSLWDTRLILGVLKMYTPFEQVHFWEFILRKKSNVQGCTVGVLGAAQFSNNENLIVV